MIGHSLLQEEGEGHVASYCHEHCLTSQATEIVAYAFECVEIKCINYRKIKYQ